MTTKQRGSVSRRGFFKTAVQAGAAVVVVAPMIVPSSVLGQRAGAVPPSDQIVMGGIGIGGRGGDDLRALLSFRQARFVAICDVKNQRREELKSMIDKKYADHDCAMYSDQFEILARQDIDAVLIATGDRWHTVAADVGPLVNWPPMPSHDWLPAEPEPPKSVLDWDRWLGPAPWRPFNSTYTRGGWRNFYDFHGGAILEWGSHTADMCQWAAKSDHTQPVTYEPEIGGDAPYSVHCRFANGLKLEMRDEGWNGRLGLGSCTVRFEGDNGWVETGDSSKIEVSENLRHLLRPTTGANVALACNSHITCQAAFIAFQLGRKLTWDPVKKEFPGEELANRMRSRALREPWRI